MVSKRIVLHFPPATAGQPIVCRLAKDYDLEFSILKATVNPREEGLLVLELSGPRREYERGLEYLRQKGVLIQPLGQDIRRNDERCMHCGACTSVCPSGGLRVEASTRLVNFDPAKCIACEGCIKVCPVRAMELHY